MRRRLAVVAIVAATISPYGTPAPDLLAIFTPPHAPAGRYEVYVSQTPIDQLAEQLRTPEVRWPDGAWRIERLEPLDAFGEDGRYDRYRLMQLFGGTRPRVARGPLVVARDGRSVGSVTLISPYPDADLTALRSGTLVILVHARTKSGVLGFWGSGVLGFWGSGVLRFWGSGVLRF